MRSLLIRIPSASVRSVPKATFAQAIFERLTKAREGREQRESLLVQARPKTE